MTSMARRRRALMRGAEIKKKIPPEYQEVTYLQAQRGPYINSGVRLTNGSVRIKASVRATSGGNWGNDFVGVRSGSSSGKQGLMIKSDNALTYVCASSGNASGSGSCKSTDAGIDYDKDARCDIDVTLSAGGSSSATMTAIIEQNGKSGTVSVGPIVSGSNTQDTVTLLGSSNSGTRTHGILYGRTYVWNDGELVIEAVPCYRIADGEVGIYNLVTGDFCTNAGSGNILKGDDAT